MENDRGSFEQPSFFISFEFETFLFYGTNRPHTFSPICLNVCIIFVFIMIGTSIRRLHIVQCWKVILILSIWYGNSIELTQIQFKIKIKNLFQLQNRMESQFVCIRWKYTHIPFALRLK